MKHLKSILLAILLGVVIYLSWSIYHVENERRKLKADRIELSDIKYGFLNVDEWKVIATDIITKKVNQLDLEDSDRTELRSKITQLLNQLMDDYEKSYKEEKSKSIGGLLQGVVANLTGTFGQMRKQIPEFTDRIMAFVEDPDQRNGIRTYILTQLNKYADETFQSVDYSTYNQVLLKHQSADKETALRSIETKMDTNKSTKEPLLIALFSCILFVLLYLIFNPGTSPIYIVLITAICFCLLALGIAMPMIDIDARISEMSLTLLGEQVQFKNQVIFFRSKSILEVTQIMLAQGKWDIFLVGGLIFMFSVVFPSLKLIAGCMYAVMEKLRRNRVIGWIVFKTGKWSMADVMVVAVFMSYIGFSGILSEQLRQLDQISNTIQILSTNASELQSGFFIFTAFVILSLFLAQRLQDRYRVKSAE